MYCVTCDVLGFLSSARHVKDVCFHPSVFTALYKWKYQGIKLTLGINRLLSLKVTSACWLQMAMLFVKGVFYFLDFFIYKEI